MHLAIKNEVSRSRLSEVRVQTAQTSRQTVTQMSLNALPQLHLQVVKIQNQPTTVQTPAYYCTFDGHVGRILDAAYLIRCHTRVRRWLLYIGQNKNTAANCLWWGQFNGSKTPSDVRHRRTHGHAGHVSRASGHHFHVLRWKGKMWSSPYHCNDMQWCNERDSALKKCNVSGCMCNLNKWCDWSSPSPNWKLWAGHRAPSLQRTSFFIIKCDITRFLCTMHAFEVLASSSPLGYLCVKFCFLFLLRPPLLS